MSSQNILANKRLRSHTRAERKANAAKRIPHLGVRVNRETVLSHRYLAQHDLPFSFNIAMVKLTGDEQEAQDATVK